mgnify:CR=1 FL=1
MPPKVLIRCDAAPAIGFGHVVRCLALADALRDGHGCEVSFAMLQGPEGFEQVRANGYVVHQLQPSSAILDEGEWLQELIANHQQQALILDVRTDLATSAVQSIRATGVLIVTIDDPSARRLFADLAFYPPVPQVARLDWTGFTGKRFVGWDWVLLRPQFAEAAQRARAWTAESMADPPSLNRRLTLLVTMGGSDPAGLTLLALDAIEKIEGDFRTLVVIGSGFMHDAALADWLARANRTYEIRRDVTDMASLMAAADLAVASFGATSYELTAMGLPAIYLSLTHDHVESAQLFEKYEIAINIGHYEKIGVGEITNILGNLLTDHQQRFAFAQRANQLIDGFGANRIAALIVNDAVPSGYTREILNR